MSRLPSKALALNPRTTAHQIETWNKFGNKNDYLRMSEAYAFANVLENELIAEAQNGHVVVTRDQMGNILAVTRQDAEGQVLSMIAEKEYKHVHTGGLPGVNIEHLPSRAGGEFRVNCQGAHDYSTEAFNVDGHLVLAGTQEAIFVTKEQAKRFFDLHDKGMWPEEELDLANLVELVKRVAKRQNKVVTIDLEPVLPLRIGDYQMVAEIRDNRTAYSKEPIQWYRVLRVHRLCSDEQWASEPLSKENALVRAKSFNRGDGLVDIENFFFTVRPETYQLKESTAS